MKQPPLLSMKQRDVRLYEYLKNNTWKANLFSHKRKLEVPYFQNSKSLSLHSTPNLKICYFNLYFVINLIRAHKNAIFWQNKLL